VKKYNFIFNFQLLILFVVELLSITYKKVILLYNLIPETEYLYGEISSNVEFSLRVFCTVVFILLQTKSV